MINFVITKAGLIAAANASSSGPAVSITSFAVGSASNYTPLPTDVALRGSTLYTQGISGYSVDTSNLVHYDCIMNESVGPFTFGECGLYLADGTLFALGALDTPQQKTQTVGAVLGNVVTLQAALILQQSEPTLTFPITSVVTAKMVQIASVDLLKPPLTSDTNAYITDSLTSTGANINVYRINDSKWGIDGFTEVYSSTTSANGGSGYTGATTAVGVGGGGSPQATFTPTVSGGVVTGITLNSFGGDYLSAPNILFSIGSGAQAKATMAQGVSTFTITNVGSGYSSAPAVSITGGGGSGATAVASVSGGVITNITVTNPGTGYSSNPTIGITGGGGSNGAATARSSMVVASVALVNNSTTCILASAFGGSVPIDATAGKYIVQITNGVLAGLLRMVSATNYSSLEFTTPLASIPVVGSGFKVYRENQTMLSNPTPPLLNNSKMLATTEFVKTTGLSFGACFGVYGNTQLTTSNLGVSNIATVTAGNSTLPPAGQCPSGSVISITCLQGVNHTVITYTPSSNIYSAKGISTNFFLDSGESAQFVSNGTDWFVVSYSIRTVPTAAFNDSSLKLANTAFVKNKGVSFGGLVVVSASQTFATDALGKIFLATTTALTTTLPPAASCPTGSTLTFSCMTGVTHTLKGNAAETLITPVSSVNTFTFTQGESIQLVSNGSGWYSSYYSARTGVTPSQFDSSTKLATTEFVKNAGVKFASLSGMSTSSTLPVSNLGQLYVLTTNATTQTLPPVASCPVGSTITFSCLPNVSAVIKGNGTDPIVTEWGVANTLQLYGGDTIQLVSNTVSWYPSSYRSAIATTQSVGNNTTKIATTAFVQAAIANIAAFAPAGTRMLFSQASAPAGWTQETYDVDNNRLMRVVAGAGLGAGGGHSPIYNDVVVGHVHSFVTGNENANHTHGVADPGHTHPGGETNIQNLIGGGSGAYVRLNYQASIATGSSSTGITSTAGISANHQHGGSTDGGSSNTPWSPRYVDIICCKKS